MSDDQKTAHTITVSGLTEFAERVRTGPEQMREAFDRSMLRQLEAMAAEGKLDPWSVSKLIELRQKYPTGDGE